MPTTISSYTQGTFGQTGGVFFICESEFSREIGQDLEEDKLDQMTLNQGDRRSFNLR